MSAIEDFYYLDPQQQDNGTYYIHRKSCQYLSLDYWPYYLGLYKDYFLALDNAKQTYSKVAPCAQGCNQKIIETNRNCCPP